MSDRNEYIPPKVWSWDKTSGGTFANINRPVAGATHEKELPVGKHPLQLYSLATPNGQKVTIMLEELLALGNSGAEYDAWLIKIGDGDQFGAIAGGQPPGTSHGVLAGKIGVEHDQNSVGSRPHQIDIVPAHIAVELIVDRCCCLT